MQVVHDPGNARAYVLLTVLALPTVLVLLIGGITAAVLVAIGTAFVLVVWRLLLLPGVSFISDIVDNVRGVPPGQYTGGARTSGEPVSLLDIGITCEGGATFEDPSVDLLAHLLRTRSPGDSFLILDRLDGTPGDPFAQALADADGTWAVEYCESQEEPLYHAETSDADLVRTVLVAWCLRTPNWRDLLAWAPLDP